MDQFLAVDFGKMFNFVKAFLYGLLITLDINMDTVSILTTLMIMDTVVGVLKSLRLGQSFSFQILTWGFVSKLAVLIVPVTLALIGKALTFDFTWFVNATLDILVLSEGFSIITNVLAIKERKHIKNTDLMTKLLNVIRRGMMKIINNIMISISAGIPTIEEEEENEQQQQQP